VCAPPDCAERLAEVGVPLVPVGEPVRTLVHGAAPPSMADVPRRIAELIAAWFDKVAAAAEGCDALVASGLMPAAAGARSVAEKLGIHSGAIRTDGTTVAAKLLLDAVSRERPPVSG
jgi:vancomycin aglycone glucosyltransferase